MVPVWSSEIKELELLLASVKIQLPELEKDLLHLIKTDDENVALLYARRCLEIIVTDLCEGELKRPRGTEPLKGVIDKLLKEKVIHPNIFTSMDHLNSLSTYGTHPKDFDPEQVKPVLNNLAIIIKWDLKHKESRTAVKSEKKEPPPDKVPSPDIEGLVGLKKPLFKSRKNIIIFSVLVFTGLIIIALLVLFNIKGERKKAGKFAEIEKSIAVLPFENLSPEDEESWFSEGMTDIIIGQLSKISDLRVLSRTSTLKYSDEKKSIAEIGKELGVNFIIEGTVQRQENKMRISVQLIRVFNEGHLWSDVYDREWKDIFDIQSEIAQSIAEQLKTVLTPEEKERIEKIQTENPEAYNLYLQGRFYWNKRTKEGLEKSVEYFEKAITVDPNYALAYAGLADAYFIRAWWGWIPLKEGFAHAKDLAYHSLQLDQNLSEAHTVLGALLNYNDWNWEEARKELELAIRLDPNFVTAHHYYSELLDILREYDEARIQINLALELDPFLPVLHALSGGYYYHEGKLNNALDAWNVCLGIDPEYASGSINFNKFLVYLRQQKYSKAIEELQTALQMDTATAEQAGLVNEIYIKSGMKGLFNWLTEIELKNPEPSHLAIARFYSLLDRREEALEWLEKAVESKDVDVPRINVNPEFDRLRSEPRFQALIKEMGLSEYSK